jgi:hypothetical protein
MNDLNEDRVNIKKIAGFGFLFLLVETGRLPAGATEPEPSSVLPASSAYMRGEANRLALVTAERVTLKEPSGVPAHLLHLGEIPVEMGDLRPAEAVGVDVEDHQAARVDVLDHECRARHAVGLAEAAAKREALGERGLPGAQFASEGNHVAGLEQSTDATAYANRVTW